MARPPRVQYAGAVYHVMARGNHGQAIFKDDKDRERFLETFSEARAKTGWRIYACPTTITCCCKRPKPNLVEGIKLLQGTYTQTASLIPV